MAADGECRQVRASSEVVAVVSCVCESPQEFFQQQERGRVGWEGIESHLDAAVLKYREKKGRKQKSQHLHNGGLSVIPRHCRSPLAINNVPVSLATSPLRAGDTIGSPRPPSLSWKWMQAAPIAAAVR